MTEIDLLRSDKEDEAERVYFDWLFDADINCGVDCCAFEEYARDPIGCKLLDEK